MTHDCLTSESIMNEELKLYYIGLDYLSLSLYAILANWFSKVRTKALFIIFGLVVIILVTNCVLSDEVLGWCSIWSRIIAFGLDI